jgi:hypothetical protein
MYRRSLSVSSERRMFLHHRSFVGERSSPLQCCERIHRAPSRPTLRYTQGKRRECTEALSLMRVAMRRLRSVFADACLIATPSVQFRISDRPRGDLLSSPALRVFNANSTPFAIVRERGFCVGSGISSSVPLMPSPRPSRSRNRRSRTKRHPARPSPPARHLRRRSGRSHKDRCQSCSSPDSVQRVHETGKREQDEANDPPLPWPEPLRIQLFIFTRHCAGAKNPLCWRFGAAFTLTGIKPIKASFTTMPTVYDPASFGMSTQQYDSIVSAGWIVKR